MSQSRLLPPRASLALHAKQLQQRLLIPGIRYASSAPPPKPRLLAKPERFNPPSHPSRIRSKPKYYGPPLNENERDRQQTRQYPHMMPPEGSFTYWFLTNRVIHLYITLGVLASLCVAIWYQNFMHTTPYRDLLPPNSMFFAHPIVFLRRWWEVYEMHVTYTSQQTAERRRQRTEDVAKRTEYRKAHGIENKASTFFGGLGPKEEGQSEDAPMKEGLAAEAAGQASGTLPEGSFLDFQGNVQSTKKKWLGIW